MPMDKRAPKAPSPGDAAIPEYLKTSSGGWDDLMVTFRDPYFGFDPAYVDDAGEMLLSMIVDWVTDDPDVGDGGVIAQQRVTIGSGWEQQDGGKRVTRLNGRAKGFNKGSYMGLLVDKVMQLAPQEAMARFKATGLQANDAAFWEGFTAHMVQTELPKFRGEAEARERLLPDGDVHWVGSEGEAKKGAKKVAKKATPVATPTPAPAAEEDAAEGEGDTAEEGSNTTLDAIIAIARTSESDEQFIVRCYDEVEGLDSDGDAMALVDDVDSPTGTWALYGPGGERHAS